MIWSPIADPILNRGTLLLPIGVNNFALSYEDALFALDNLLIANIGVLGGDVYLHEGNVFSLTYEDRKSVV